ncbi:MAG: hypothetical protein HY649_05580 [Acidobacteria bacterium]|nr:hypothetical protein [Acidobacteriota bacterium]
MTATVRSGTTLLSGASGQFTMTRQANNKSTTKTVTTGSNGIATWKYKLQPKDPLGIYTVTAVATYGSQSATSAPVTFTLQ